MWISKVILYCHLTINLSDFQWKIRKHINESHNDKIEKAQTITLSPGTNYVVFLEKFFPSIIPNGNADEETKIKKEEIEEISEFMQCQVEI